MDMYRKIEEESSADGGKTLLSMVQLKGNMQRQLALVGHDDVFAMMRLVSLVTSSLGEYAFQNVNGKIAQALLQSPLNAK